MKKILGLDLGVASIGWALVSEAENRGETSSIDKLGVRVNPLTADETFNFEKGKSITTNAERTLKRSMRRNLQRYKLRRENLIEILKKHGFISDSTILSEDGNHTTFQTYRFRAKAAKEEVTLEQFAQILLMINKKRGYKSSRKAKSEDEGQLIDGMAIAMRLYEEKITPGELAYDLLQEGKKFIPEFYRSDLQVELERIWDFQQQFYPDILTEKFKQEIAGKAKTVTAKLFKTTYDIFTAENKGAEKQRQAFKWRVEALSKKVTAEELAFVISEVNGSISSSSGYLGAISDRSKALYFNRQTVGQNLMAQLEINPHTRLKNQVFYRQDYLDEFEVIWETQAKFHPVLRSAELKSEIRDVIIFYQRRLKSQKGLISFCEHEKRQIPIEKDGKRSVKTNGLRVAPRSSHIFQEFKIWQILNNIKITDVESGIKEPLTLEEKELLFEELSIKKELKSKQALELLYDNPQKYKINYETIDGNKTQASLFEAYGKIIELSGHDKYNFQKMSYREAIEVVEPIFKELGINTAILRFDSSLEGDAFEKQPLYRLWHLLYSFEGDNSNTGSAKLIEKLTTLYGFEKEYAHILANITFLDDYGSLSTKAMRKILPFMREGTEYSEACLYAGYLHSKKSLTKEQKEKKIYKDRLDLLPKNSLRNPVVEKILNQMVNVINAIIDTYGKPDEIRIELARELKNNAKQREKMSKVIKSATENHKAYREILKDKYGLQQISRNDIIRYKLYLELKENGYKTLYSNTYIAPEKLFSKEFDIEHIIPKARLFDDSFSNKTLELSSINKEKDKETAYDYVSAKYGAERLEEYTMEIDKLFKSGAISKTKATKLKMKASEIPEGFINRDLSDTQYIAKKAKEILEDLVKEVLPTTGAITDRLREDWQLIDVMKELNWDKYHLLGMTDVFKNRDGHVVKRIRDWTKRNDHRHHAMDALTVAFTKYSYIHYLNNLNARYDDNSNGKSKVDPAVIRNIEKKELEKDSKGKLRFIPPVDLNDFRAEAKRQLENILISIKAKNKVVTKNINKTKKTGGANRKVQLTPRGQLHMETVYGSIKRRTGKEEKIGAKFDAEKIGLVTSRKYREALLARLDAFGGDPKKAFTAKNSLSKNPIYLNKEQTAFVPEKVKVFQTETIYTIRKEIDPKIVLSKVIDAGIRAVLEKRLEEYSGDSKAAFSNLDENPIWLDKAKGVAVKRVTIQGISNGEALHEKRDKEGRLMLDKAGKNQAVDFVSTGNNHHVAIYRDGDGKLQERVVSFYEATSRANMGLSIVDKRYKEEEDWEFLFTMKQNEYFLFPNEEQGFNPRDIDLRDPDNYAQISPNMFRVQKFSTKDYVFRHHLETAIEDNNVLKGVTWLRIGVNGLKDVVKVRVNHIGEIVDIGEY